MHQHKLFKSRTHKVSKNKPNVLKSLIKSSGPIPKAAVAIEGSVKYLVSEVRIADLLLIFGFQAVESSITNIFFKALM